MPEALSCDFLRQGRRGHAFTDPGGVWNKLQLELCRELFGVVFREAEPTEDLLSRALDFLDGH